MDKDITVVKVGSNTVIDSNGAIRKDVIHDILSSIGRIMHNGTGIILVTSGAVKSGGIVISNVETTTVASVGEPKIFTAYYDEAQKLNISIAHLLLTRPYIVEREHFLNLQKTINELFDQGIIPVINENDALVANTNWSFGDNDALAAALAISFKAKRLIIVSHVDGLFESDPTQDASAKLIDTVRDVNAELLKYASKNTSSGGRGGMISKLKAARIATAVGIEARIINGTKSGNLTRALRGERVGTVFLPRSVKVQISNRDRWLIAAKNSAGSIEIDQGAVEALRRGKSLLAVGVKKVYGQFDAKEIIEIVDSNKQGVAFGIVDYSDKETSAMLRSNNLKGKQLMHTDNMIKIL